MFLNLLQVMEELDPSSTPTEVNVTWRDEAVAFVKDGHAIGKGTTWADVHKLIQEQDGQEEALEEGLEAFGAAAVDITDDSLSRTNCRTVPSSGSVEFQTHLWLRR